MSQNMSQELSRVLGACRLFAALHARSWELGSVGTMNHLQSVLQPMGRATSEGTALTKVVEFMSSFGKRLKQQLVCHSQPELEGKNPLLL